MSMQLTEQLEELSKLLDVEIAAMQKLLDAATSKKTALIRADVAAVGKWTNHEIEAAQNAAAAGDARIASMVRTGKTIDVDLNKMPIQALALRVGEPFKTRLLAQRTALAGVIAKVRRTNEQNRSLSEQSLKQLRLFLNMITTGNDGQPCYTRNGVESRPETASRLNLVDQVA
ncbi:MAG: flagellar protein FlgN [Planctomycetota bacterium]|nr:flagellar protein FlgN [Planctomycetota bacterium]